MQLRNIYLLLFHIDWEATYTDRELFEMLFNMTTKIFWLGFIFGFVHGAAKELTSSNCTSEELTLAMRVNGSYRSLIPVKSGFLTLHLVAEDLSCCQAVCPAVPSEWP